MTPDSPVYLCLAFGLAAALVGGVFQSFSDFVMRGLSAAGACAGSAGMIGLNRTVFRSAFLATFMALVPGSLGFAVYAVFAINGAAKAWVIAAALIYVPLVFLVTMVGNVPRNNRLDRLEGDGAADYWPPTHGNGQGSIICAPGGRSARRSVT